MDFTEVPKLIHVCSIALVWKQLRKFMKQSARSANEVMKSEMIMMMRKCHRGNIQHMISHHIFDVLCDYI